jgi:pSer/pThr/pTyr-binding forkhead associated (FHA) protein
MPKLILQFEGRVLKECAVGSSASIGRLPDNTVVIDNPAVSSRHARVMRDGDDFILEDLKSTNGTFVNGTRITRHTLQDGDVVLVGKHSIAFETALDEEVAAVDAPEPVLAGFGGTMFLDTKQQKALLAKAQAIHATSEAPTAAVGVELAAKASAPATKVGILHVLAGNSDASEYTLRGQTSLIGKSDSALVRLKGWFKPKTALAIARKGDVYTATLLGGKTLVNNQPLNGRQELKDGDVLQVSGLTLEFRLR